MAARNIVALGWVSLLLAFEGHAEAQDRDDALACWWSYASCATESHGDQSWRSICYADFARCLTTTTIPNCPLGGEVEECSAFVKDCKELADGATEFTQQCIEDMDACLLAHGC